MKVAAPRSAIHNPFTGKPIKAGGATAARLETLAKSDPDRFRDQLVAAGWDKREATNALKLWRRATKAPPEEEKVEQPWEGSTFADIQDKALNRRWSALRDGLSGTWAERTIDGQQASSASAIATATHTKQEDLVMFVYTVLESWAWDPIHGAPLPDCWAWVAEGQKWTGSSGDERLLLALLETCGRMGKPNLFAIVLAFADWVKGVEKRMSPATRERVIALICKHCRRGSALPSS